MNEEEEIWKPMVTKGYEPIYEVSSLGNVRETESKKPMKLHECISGNYTYPCVYLQHNHVKKQAFVPILVADAFLGAPPYSRVVTFKDGNSLNCRADNVMWRVPKILPKPKPSPFDISIDYIKRWKGKACDITVVNILNGTIVHATHEGVIATFIGVKQKDFPLFLSGEHYLCKTWKVIPYEDRWKYSRIENVLNHKWD